MAPLLLLLCWVRTFRRQVTRRQWRRQRRRSILLDSTEPLKTQEEVEAEPAPPPAAGPSTDGVLQRRRWKQAALRERYRVALADFRGDPRRSPSWRRFPNQFVEDETSIWKGSNLPTSSFGAFVDAIADNVFRDACRFLGCFEHDDVAGHDLPNLTVSIRRAGLTKHFFFSDLWQAKPAYVVSLKVPLEHFLQCLEKEERVHRAVGGLTTALGSVIKALYYDLSMFARAQKAKCRAARAGKVAKLMEVGSDIWKENGVEIHAGPCVHS